MAVNKFSIPDHVWGKRLIRITLLLLLVYIKNKVNVCTILITRVIIVIYVVAHPFSLLADDNDNALLSKLQVINIMEDILHYLRKTLYKSSTQCNVSLLKM